MSLAVQRKVDAPFWTGVNSEENGSLEVDTRANRVGRESLIGFGIDNSLRKVRADLKLLRFFTILCQTTSALKAPLFQGSPAQKAEQIRVWLDRESLDQITHLNFSGTSLQDLPPEINLFKNLQRLILSSTQISTLPPGLYLPQLQELDLSKTPLEIVPATIRLPNLTMLCLSGTNISSLPDGCDFPKLSWLDLSHTPLKKLPTWKNMGKISYLDLEGTKLDEFPEEADLPSLADLNLRATRVFELVQSPRRPKLTRLDLGQAPSSDA